MRVFTHGPQSVIYKESIMASNVVGPLTNIFTPPASCSSIYITCPVWSTRGREDRGTTFCMLTSSASCDSSDNVVPDPACWASGEEFIAIRTLTSEAQPVYFPALECPSGLTIAHTVRDGTVSGVYSTTLVSVADTDTAAYCCPRWVCASSYTIFSPPPCL